MRARFLLIACAAFSFPAFAAQYSLTLKPENTKIEWTLTDVLHTVHGNFNLKSGQIDFDPETGTASGQVVVDVMSGKSGSEARDHRMHTSVLESSKYPEAVFTPDRLNGQFVIPGDSNLKLHGSFKIHGAAHEMIMNVQTRGSAEQMNATITFDVPYVAWGMKDPSNFLLKVNKTVEFSIQSTAALTKR